MTLTPPDRLVGPSIWSGRDLDRNHASWLEHLSDAEIDELLSLVAALRAEGRSLLDVGRTDVALPILGERLDRVRTDLDIGRGFVVLRGLPMDELSDEQAALAYWLVGLHLGELVTQNARGHLLGHVRDESRSTTDGSARAYQTREHIGYHMDQADAVGLLCLRTARSGGLSSLASAGAVYNEAVRRRPDLKHLWFDRWYYDRRDEQPAGELPYIHAPLAVWANDLLSMHYGRGFMDSAQRLPDVPRRTEIEVEFLDLVDGILDEDGVALHIEFQPGDIQWVSNYAVMHSRTSYEDWEDPAERRHLLRLWVRFDSSDRISDDIEIGGISDRHGIRPLSHLVEDDAGTKF